MDSVFKVSLEWFFSPEFLKRAWGILQPDV